MINDLTSHYLVIANRFHCPHTKDHTAKGGDIFMQAPPCHFLNQDYSRLNLYQYDHIKSREE